MNFFGEWSVHDYPDNKELWILHNPVSPWLWGVSLDDGQQVVPCDQFVFDMSSTRYIRVLWPQHWGRKASTHHDWGHHVHKTPVEELLIELKPWFDYMERTIQQRMDYIAWLKSRSQKDWDDDFYQLCELEKINKVLRWFGYRTLRLLGWIAWDSPRTGKTKAFRENNHAV